MLVAMILGALRNRTERAPAQVLRFLNETLYGQMEGGFVTACAVRFHDDGSLEIASAGHLAPYLDGAEIALPAGLPLGLAPDAEYESASTASGNCLTLVSDGVIEAARFDGELFGFDRTREISARLAREIAEAAKAWGQNDDITVVSVRRANA
jgi:serine phosphatase RsbU (regulator of sigma subunit)